MSDRDLRFSIFGRIVALRREGGRWRAFDLPGEGKRVPADFVVPDFVEEAELAQFLFDLFHESAVGDGEVRRLEGGGF